MHNDKLVGGGAKKILYTLSTLKRIGLRNSVKALNAHNACKACGLGMGGQRGGMVNELGEYPSVCNKSVQAQSTDIQAAIPEEIFARHPLKDFQELTGQEIEHLGRLGFPLYKARDSQFYNPIDWARALQLIQQTMLATPPARSFFYASGRSSNEAGFLLQLLARLYGTNNVNNCSYYCHQASGVGLQNAIGSGTATVELQDLALADLVFLIGANPASNHPRLIHKLKDLRERGGQVVVINPAKEPGLVRFAVPKSPKSLIFGGTEIASHYVQPRIGGDIALLTGIAKALIENQDYDARFVQAHTENSPAYFAAVANTSWDTISEHSGVPSTEIRAIAKLYAGSQRAIFAWGMGITHHRHGVDNVESIANLALLRGMIGKPGAGLLPLRGHSNVQGIGSIGVKPVLPDEVLTRIEQHYGIDLPRSPGMDTLACLEAAARGEMDFALLMGGNLYAASPDHAWARKALDAIGFKVFLTTTLNHGHVFGVENGESLVLPVRARDEEQQATTQESMFNYVRMSDGGIDRLAGPRGEVDILADLAGPFARGLDTTAFKQHRSLRQAIAAAVPGMAALADIDETRAEFHVRGRILHTADFATASGKARFTSPSLPAPPATDLFPFTLMSVRSEGQFNTIIYEEQDSYRGVKERWSVMMNPTDMAALELRDGDYVNVYSDHGAMRGLRVCPFDLPTGNLMAYFPEANRLIGRERDERSQTPAFKSVAVRVELA